MVELRSQLFTAQHRAYHALETQQYEFHAAAQQFEAEARLTNTNSINRVRAEEDAQICALETREHSVQKQMMNLERNLVLARSHALASDGVVRSQDAMLSEVEGEASDKIRALEAEVNDAMTEASRLKVERDVNFSRAEMSFIAAHSKLSILAPNESMDHVAQPTEPISPIQSDAFRSPEEKIGSRGSIDPPPPSPPLNFSDSPLVFRTSRAMCSEFSKGKCARGQSCLDLHYGDKLVAGDLFSTVSYGTESSNSRRDASNNPISFNDTVTYHSPKQNKMTRSFQSPLPKVYDIGSGGTIVPSDHTTDCGGDAELKSRIKKLKN